MNLGLALKFQVKPYEYLQEMQFCSNLHPVLVEEVGIDESSQKFGSHSKSDIEFPLILMGLC